MNTTHCVVCNKHFKHYNIHLQSCKHQIKVRIVSSDNVHFNVCSKDLSKHIYKKHILSYNRFGEWCGKIISRVPKCYKLSSRPGFIFEFYPSQPAWMTLYIVILMFFKIHLFYIFNQIVTYFTKYDVHTLLQFCKICMSWWTFRIPRSPLWRVVELSLAPRTNYKFLPSLL